MRRKIAQYMSLIDIIILKKELPVATTALAPVRPIYYSKIVIWAEMKDGFCLAEQYIRMLHMKIAFIRSIVAV